MTAHLKVALSILLIWMSIPGSWAAEESREQFKGLDEQVQDIKSDVLGIASELNRLEEKLLYPSGTQVAMFVSLVKGEKFRLDSVGIQLDGKPVAYHVYSFKELEALQKGGVQRIYVGNIGTGPHQLQVSVAGKSTSGDYRRDATATITKDVGPKLVEIKLAGPGSASDIEIRD
jgi:hypothetical protein